jgi:putative tryptophan/tyrosine transport system substrate-binding protein
VTGDVHRFAVDVADLQEASRTIPIVFVTTIDPVGSGLVTSLSHPGSNATGFIAWEFSLSAKLLELLKEIAPAVKRVAVIGDTTVPAGSGGFAAIQTAAQSFGVELTAIGVRNAGEIEQGIVGFARGSNGGLLVVGPPSSMMQQRDLVEQASRRLIEISACDPTSDIGCPDTRPSMVLVSVDTRPTGAA